MHTHLHAVRVGAPGSFVRAWGFRHFGIQQSLHTCARTFGDRLKVVQVQMARRAQQGTGNSWCSSRALPPDRLPAFPVLAQVGGGPLPFWRPLQLCPWRGALAAAATSNRRRPRPWARRRGQLSGGGWRGAQPGRIGLPSRWAFAGSVSACPMQPMRPVSHGAHYQAICFHCDAGMPGLASAWRCMPCRAGMAVAGAAGD